MSDELICPDCGGFIGAAPGGDLQPCRCYGDVATTTETDAIEKICRVCGKQLAGHRRLKDSRGYICLDCARVEKKAGVGSDESVACAECGRRVRAAGLLEYAGTRICKKCYADHKEVSKFKAPPPSLAAHNTTEKASIIRMLIIAFVLALIFVLGMMGFMKHF